MASMCMFNEHVCVICRNNFTSSTDCDVAEVTRGLPTLIAASEKHDDKALLEYLLSKPKVVRVHNSCRRNYASKRRFVQNENKSEADSLHQPKSLRSLCNSSFCWKTHCFFCSEVCKFEPLSKANVRRVETLVIKPSILEQCKIRGDSLAMNVQGRLLSCCDLVAEEAVYHVGCHRNFFREALYDSRGRPVDSKKARVFDDLCQWLEVNDCELLTLHDIATKAEALSGGDSEMYSEKWLKHKLIERYGEHIQFCQVLGKKNVVCWKEMAAYIVNEKWQESQKEDKCEHIVVQAAKLLRTVIREHSYQTETYPSTSEISNLNEAKKWLPNLLLLFMDHLIFSEEKKVALGHCIVQAVRPRTAIAPIPFGIGVSVDSVCASKYLLNLLYSLGLSVSYDEVRRFKHSAMSSKGLHGPQSFPGNFTQYAADNLDHNVCSLDGSGTLHAMGIISISNTVNCNDTENETSTVIERVKVLSAAEVAKFNETKLLPYYPPTDSTFDLTFKSNFHNILPSTTSPSVNLDLLYHVAWFLCKDSVRPSWAGFNSCIVRDIPVSTSDIRMLPIIDANPTSMPCVYSTLIFIIEECQKLCIPTPTVTFDQPLWLKATFIARSLNLNIVCRLGTFHLQMNFLGSIGTLMAGSGLNDVLECCYGTKTVEQIMSGKAVSRATRAHFLVEAALNVLLLESVLPSEPLDLEAKLHELADYYNDIVTNAFQCHETFPASLFIIEQSLNTVKQQLSENSATATFWLLYIEYVGLLKNLLRAERMGDWQLHLDTVRRMTNVFAATGHNNYAKCTRLYVEIMSELPHTHPQLYEQFMNGSHVAHRSSKSWSGLSTDLTIEQAMMRAVKSSGGLTRGRGVNESMRTTWTSTVHVTGAVRSALSQLSGTEYCHENTVHRELGESRTNRDMSDVNKILDFLRQHNPFTSKDQRLHCVTSGIASSDCDNVNCCEAESVGNTIIQSLNDKKFSDVTLRRKDQVRTLVYVTTVANHKRKPIDSIDPTVLFNRLLVIMQRSSELKPYFCYELSAMPTSLFKDNCMRKAVKSQLSTEISKLVPPSSKPLMPVYVIDGGYLLRVVVWREGASYGDVIVQYISYIDKHYGPSTIIVFDGYTSGPSIKDHEHKQRTNKKYCPNIVIDLANPAHRDQYAFLSNDHNKVSLIELLIKSLRDRNYVVYQAANDADTLIVDTALQQAGNHEVSVIGNDTDLLVLLVHHFRDSLKDIFMYTDSNHLKCIRTIVHSIGLLAAHRLLVIHAISGCDTTSALFGHGKLSAFKKLKNATGVDNLFDVMENPAASHQCVTEAGLKLLSLLYSEVPTAELNNLRYHMYMNVNATSTRTLQPERLVPTENAAKFHSYRAHLQIVQWKLLTTTALNPLEWGWQLHDEQYIPVATDVDIAPPDILKVVCCKCKGGPEKQCNTRSCACKKYGLSCVAACKNCNGLSCANSNTSVVDEREMADDDILHSDGIFEDIDCQDNDLVEDDYIELLMPWITEEEC